MLQEAVELQNRSPKMLHIEFLHQPVLYPARSLMGEPSSLTGDVGPAFPVVIPVGRASPCDFTHERRFCWGLPQVLVLSKKLLRRR